jgi:hypothetical protein
VIVLREIRSLMMSCKDRRWTATAKAGQRSRTARTYARVESGWRPLWPDSLALLPRLLPRPDPFFDCFGVSSIGFGQEH